MVWGVCVCVCVGVGSVGVCVECVCVWGVWCVGVCGVCGECVWCVSNTTHCSVSQLGVRGHLELLVNKSIEKPLPHTSGNTSIDSEGKLGPGHISLWGEGNMSIYE